MISVSKKLLLLSSLYLGTCSGCKESPNEVDSGPKEFPLRYAVVMTPVPDSHGNELFTFNYYPEKDQTVGYNIHFNAEQRLKDTLSYKIEETVSKGVKVQAEFGISREWIPGQNRFYKIWRFPEKIIESAKDSLLIYHFPQDTLFLVKGNS